MTEFILLNFLWKSICYIIYIDRLLWVWDNLFCCCLFDNII
jgi:hypothetical protein